MYEQERRKDPEVTTSTSNTVTIKHGQSHETVPPTSWDLCFEQAGLGMAYINSDGSIQRTNTRLASMLDWSPKELQGTSFLQSIHLEHREAVAAYIQTAAGGATHHIYTAEGRYLTKNGTPFWGSSTLAPVFDTTGTFQYFMLTLQDLNAQKEREEHTHRLLHDIQTRASQLEAIFESINDNVFAYDTNEHLLQINKAMREYSNETDFGEQYNARTLRDRVAQYEMRYENGEIIPEDDWPMRRALRGEVFKGDTSIDVIFRSLDGQDLQVSFSGAPVRNQEGQIVGAVCISRDVTERRKLERQTHDALDALVAVAQTLVDNSPSITDGGTSEAVASSGHLIRQQIVELTRRVLRSQRAGILAVESNIPEIYSATTVGFSEEQEHIWFSATPGEHSRLIDVLIDSADYARLQAKETIVLDVAHSLLGTITPFFGVQEVLVAPIHMNNQLIGILYADHGTGERKYRPEEIALIEAMARLCVLVIEREHYESERVRLLTALQESNESLRQNNIQLEQVNKLQSDFISIVSHEFRTTLTGIQGFSELLRDEEFNTAEVRDFAADIHTDALRLTRMISELLDLERMKLGKMTLHLGKVDINSILRDIADRTRPTALQHHIILNLDEQLPAIEGDYDKLIQVITNLASNAVKYSPGGGEVVLSSKREGDSIHVSISDQGVGIPAEALEDVFVPYNRIESGKTHYIQGTGLGLAIVREIVHMHGGHAWVESVLGEGSTFHFMLPIVHAPVNS